MGVQSVWVFAISRRTVYGCLYDGRVCLVSPSRKELNANSAGFFVGESVPLCCLTGENIVFVPLKRRVLILYFRQR